MSQLLDIQKKDDDPCRKSAGQFSVDEICLAVAKDGIYQIYQRQRMPEVSTALHSLLKI